MVGAIYFLIAMKFMSWNQLSKEKFKENLRYKVKSNIGWNIWCGYHLEFQTMVSKL